MANAAVPDVTGYLRGHCSRVDFLRWESNGEGQADIIAAAKDYCRVSSMDVVLVRLLLS